MSAAVFDTCHGNSALLISFPHSGLGIPDALRGRFTPQALGLPDTDWHVPALYDFYRDIGASAIFANYTRYVVDLNRPADGTPLYPGKTETAVCPTRTFAGEPIYRSGCEPTAAETQDRIENYWEPYHRRLGELIDAIRTQHGHCLLWDAHSIRSQVPAFFDGRLPDLNVGTADNRSCSQNIVNRLMEGVQAQSRFSWVLNGRFKGGHITRFYGDPARGVNAVQLELAQSAYLSESAPERFDPATAADLKTVLRSLLRAVQA